MVWALESQSAPFIIHRLCAWDQAWFCGGAGRNKKIGSLLRESGDPAQGQGQGAWYISQTRHCHPEGHYVAIMKKLFHYAVQTVGDQDSV